MKEHLKMKSRPMARPENVIRGDCFRVTVLTGSLVRLEYSPDGCFTDRPTQTVLNRDFPAVEYTVRETGEKLTVCTDYFQLDYNGEAFSHGGLSCVSRSMNAQVSGVNVPAWHYGDKRATLKGTARTLDRVNGACELEEGLMSSRCGCAMLDDSHTLLLNEEGWVEPRKPNGSDIYLFVYGNRYREALKDFYYLCGEPPMLPRFVFGNWWSRYYRYTEESYMELMDSFDREEIPFSVAVIDMDWHLVDIDPKYGAGWTGYTWNRELFPDPRGFLKKLHDRGMRATLNLHPADGIRAYEECYPRMAERMGINAKAEEPIGFDIADSRFLEAYFEEVLHPMEEDGVDFWWVDWQQGTRTKVAGLDPLWMLNHYHFLDSGREEKRPMTFSRYAGPGSHRYPIGFSGDTIISWESLDFQPYFTSTASNIGFGWWSHDIGGHKAGEKNDELEARWYEYGVFSPITRLHSSSGMFLGKEPWRFQQEIHGVMNRFLRLRHQLVPYLYTMNYRAWAEGEPICQPMYYEYPDIQEAYRRKNQYLFGSELMVLPITEPRIQKLNVARVNAWLPEGLWFDFFTDRAYSGNRNLNMYRSIDSIPVLARAGAIVPMTDEIGAGSVERNPEEMTVRVFPGADHSFVLYEDDSVSKAYMEGVCARTELRLDWTGKRFVIEPVRGSEALVPGERTWKIVFFRVTALEAAVTVNGESREAAVSCKDGTLSVNVSRVTPRDRVEILLPENTRIADNPVTEQLYAFLDQAQISYTRKDKIWQAVLEKKAQPAVLMGDLFSMGISEDLLQAVMEIVCARA